MAIHAHEITGTRLAASLSCSVCSKTLEGLDKAYKLNGARSPEGNRYVAVHGRCIEPRLLDEYLELQRQHEAEYYAARDRAEDERQGLRY